MTWENSYGMTLREENPKLHIGYDFRFVKTNHRPANHTCTGWRDRESGYEVLISVVSEVG